MVRNPRSGRKPAKEPLYDTENVASFAECTGLIPAAIQDEGAVEAYAELSSVHKQQVNEESKCKE